MKIGHINKTFYISDHHFSHANLLLDSYVTRPFLNVEAMDLFMTEAWNFVVSPGDTVIYGGDLTLSSKRQYKTLVPNILNRLNGIKILVKGNHDRSHGTMVKLGFQSSSLYHFENGILVIHKLLLNWDRLKHQIEQADYVLYGHVHNLLLDDPRVAGKEKFINICVEPLAYIPRTIGELKEIRKTQLERGI